MSFVLDASCALAWCFEDEQSPVSERALDLLGSEPALVPSLWPHEIANVLVVAERRGRVSEAVASRFADLLGRLPITVDPDPADVLRLADVARRRELSAYDAAYLALAGRHGLPLATLDDRLAEAARASGVELLR